MASKKLSGAEYRKRKKLRDEVHQTCSISLHNWLQNSDISSDAGTSAIIETENIIENLEEMDKVSEIAEYNFIETDNESKQVLESKKEEEKKKEEIQSVQTIDLNDPPSWPLLSDKIKIFLVEHGPDQGKNADFKKSTLENGRKFSKEWFYKKCSNGEVIDRNWLIYSKKSLSLFCFPCILFNKTKTEATICNPQQGFKDWKNLSRICDHENSMVHRDAYLQWKCLEKRIKNNDFIDDSLQKAIESEKEKWQSILCVVLDVILFCAKNNLPLRGTNETIGSSNAGIFLNLIELISHYHGVIANQINCHKKGSVSYLSKTIQDEFILLLGNHVRCEILSKIKKAKYFSLLFDCTPDVSHHEQMCQIIRYVYINNEKIVIEESFIDFIETKEKTGSGLANIILNKLQKDGLSIENIRGQGYDNGANMAGAYKGVQSIICQKNEHAKYIPCVAHSLNLVCKNAASTNANMITFFGIVQKIYTFFVSSTSRWDALMTVLKTTLKGHTDTRWASRANAVRALEHQIVKVHQLLKEMSLNNKSTSYVENISILKQINFKFLCYLIAWNTILQEVDKVNKTLQLKTIVIHKAANLIQGLSLNLLEMRKHIVENTFMKCEKLASEMNISAEFTDKRKRKVKRLDLEKSNEEICTFSDKYIFNLEIKEVIDVMVSQLKWRSEKLNEISSDFQFLTGEKLMSMDTEDLKKAASDLALKYSIDINAVEFSSEICSFKNHAITIIPDTKKATSLDLLRVIHEYDLVQSYPNLEVALRIFLTIPVTVASAERSFSKLKLIKSYLRSSLGQEKLSNMAILSIEQEIASKINFKSIINDFASLKARKIKL